VPAPALVLASITSLQLGAAVAKGLFAEVGALGVVVLRIGVAAVLLCAVSRPRIRSRSGAELRRLGAFGLVLGAMNLAFYQSLTLLPLGVAVTLELLGPLGVAAALSRHRRDLLWVGVALAGVVLLTTGGGRVTAGGVALALLAAALRGTYVLLTRRTGRDAAGGGGLALALAAGAVVLVPLGGLRVGAALLDARVLALGLAVGVLSSALPYTLDLAALRRLPAATFGVLVSLSPAIATLVGAVVLDEALRPRQWLAVALVALASAAVSRPGPPGPPSPT
jgi:inner membrane transporter RhtA